MAEEESQSQLKDSEPTKMGGGASNFKPWLFQPGQSGNPGGMKKGTKSMKVWAREYLRDLPDEEKVEFARGLPKDILWRMAEGQPHQTNETDVKGVLKIEFASEFDKDKKDAPTPSKAE
jgi:hypothetical protein